MEEKNMKKLKLFIAVVIIGLVVWFIVIYPLLKFKSMENKMIDATKRYFEINESKLPKGTNSKKVSLDTLYKKDFIKEDLRAPYTNNFCNSEESWGRVAKKNDNYEYSVYLNCGVFKSKIDYKGPKIKLTGDNEIVIYRNSKYKELGVSSVVDDTDGVIDVKKVKIDSSSVNTSKVGTYEVTYKIKDSLDNETIKIRKVIVTQTLNSVVLKDNNKATTYKGVHDDNYILLDNILFKIVGINKDGTVKVVSSEALGNVNYAGIDTWLNDYFYEKLSDSVKEVIYPKSKWCNEKVSDPKNYNECRKYSKKKPVGLLSIIDYKNAKTNDTTNLENNVAVWTTNGTTTNGNYYVNSYFDKNASGLTEFKPVSEEQIFAVKPAVNIVKDSVIISGDGTNLNPYVLKGNEINHKKGTKISNVETGTYISYSGYTWRVIGKEEDGTTKIISTDCISGDDGAFYTKYGDELDYYNPSSKGTMAYNIANKLVSNVKTDYFAKKSMKFEQYKDKVLYGKSSSTKAYNLKIREMSLFDLYSVVSTTNNSSWYYEILKSKNTVYVNSPTMGVFNETFDSLNEYGLRVVGYLSKDVVIKDGSGTNTDPYSLTK